MANPQKVKNYIEEHDRTKDIVVYDYETQEEYMITYLNGQRVYYTDPTEQSTQRIYGLITIWRILNADILCEYLQDDIIFLQVRYNEWKEPKETKPKAEKIKATFNGSFYIINERYILWNNGELYDSEKVENEIPKDVQKFANMLECGGVLLVSKHRDALDSLIRCHNKNLTNYQYNLLEEIRDGLARFINEQLTAIIKTINKQKEPKKSELIKATKLKKNRGAK